MRGKIPDFNSNYTYDQEVHDRDAEQKARAKARADINRGARYSEVDVCDQVLLRQDESNKLSTTSSPLPYTVVSKSRNSTVVEDSSGTQHTKNTHHIKKYIAVTNSAEEEGSMKTAQVPEIIETQKQNYHHP